MARLHSHFPEEQTEARTCVPVMELQMHGLRCLQSFQDGRQRDAAPFNDWESGGHRNGLETEVLRSGPESAPPHGILHRNGMAPMVGQEVTETGSLSHAHKKPPHSSHHLLAAGLLLLPFSSKNCPHLQSARPYLLFIDCSTTAGLGRTKRPDVGQDGAGDAIWREGREPFAAP